MNTAMVLCAGFGTRLGELTKELPKPMLPVSGKPILEHTINHLSFLGVRNIVINLHYFAEKIKNYFKDGKKWNVHIEYSYEEEPLGTAGAVKKVENLLSSSSPFLVLYGDVYCDENYSKLFDFHKSIEKKTATIILHERNRSNSVVEINEQKRIIRFIERPRQKVENRIQNWVNSGLYLFEKEIFKYIPSNKFYDFPKDVFPELVKEELIYGYALSGYRCAVDSPERYQTLVEEVELNSNKERIKL